ncbi:MAG TPA: hypothetical protein VLG27_04905 [Candidatus Saccharimonadia bacterium]|nr:hypothetical protein [Candidatus Saccharimonadia bacterium]
MRFINRKTITIAAIVVIAWLVMVVISHNRFRVVSTVPGLNGIGTSSSFLQINFNRELSSNGLSLSSSPAVIDSYKASGKSLIIYLNSPMTIGQTYTIIFNKVSDTKGETMTNRSLAFVPKDLSTQQVVSNQGGAGKTKPAPYTLDSITIGGEERLLNVGVTTDIINSLKQDIFQYATSSNQQIRNFDVVETSDIQHQAPSMTPDGSEAWQFQVTLNKKTTLTARISSPDASAARLYLYDSSGNLIFDSGTANIAPTNDT